MTRIMFVCLLISLCIINTTFAEEPPKGVIVDGDPEITAEDVFSHIRLIEFILQTRLTTEQKNAFLNNLKKECAEMDKQSKEDFLQIRNLVASLPTMRDLEKSVVRNILREDYEEGANTAKDDPSAILYREIQKNIHEIIAESPGFHFTKQSLLAFFEFIEFLYKICGINQNLDANSKENLKKNIAVIFPTLPTDHQEILNGFERRWHLFKIAWNFVDDNQKKQWQSNLSKLIPASATIVTFDKEFINKILTVVPWREISSFSLSLGASETDWPTNTSIDPW